MFVVTLPGWGNLLLMCLAALLGYNAARMRLRRMPDLDVSNALKRVRHLWAVPLIIGVAFGTRLFLNERADLWWALPSWLENRYLLFLWIILLGAMVYLYAFGVTLAFQTAHAERRTLVIAVVLTMAAVQVMNFRTQRSIAPQLGHTVDAEGVVMQTSGVSCVAASAANMLRQRGIETTEKQMAIALGTTAMGTTAGAAVEMFNARGESCRKTEGQAVQTLQAPAMLMIDHPQAGPESHAVAYIGMANDQVEIWDPLEGRRLFKPAELAAIWSGRAIECAWR